MTKTICDRCTAEVQPNTSAKRIFVYKLAELTQEAIYDLCPACAEFILERITDPMRSAPLFRGSANGS